MEPGDIRIEFFKSPGPGGQHKNKRFASVRAVHIPTGLTAVGQELRSQAQNKELALARLTAKVKKAFHRPKPRVATKTTRGAKERRLEQKRKHSIKKRLRAHKIDIE